MLLGAGDGNLFAARKQISVDAKGPFKPAVNFRVTFDSILAISAIQIYSPHFPIATLFNERVVSALFIYFQV